MLCPFVADLFLDGLFVGLELLHRLDVLLLFGDAQVASDCRLHVHHQLRLAERLTHLSVIRRGGGQCEAVCYDEQLGCG